MAAALESHSVAQALSGTVPDEWCCQPSTESQQGHAAPPCRKSLRPQPRQAGLRFAQEALVVCEAITDIGTELSRPEGVVLVSQTLNFVFDGPVEASHECINRTMRLGSPLGVSLGLDKPVQQSHESARLPPPPDPREHCHQAQPAPRPVCR